MDQISIAAVNFDELQTVLANASNVTGRFSKTVLFRFSRRVAKRVKVDSLTRTPWHRRRALASTQR